MAGKVSIEHSGEIKFGMIKLGCQRVGFFPNNGVRLEIMGALKFMGRCYVGAESNISVGQTGCLTVKDDVAATAAFKCVCYTKSTIGEHVTFGWDCCMMDTNFHQCIDRDNNPVGTPYAPIVIGDYCWFASRNSIIPGAVLPERCVVASNSLTNKNYDIKPYTMIGGIPAKPIKEGVWMCRGKDQINYKE